MPEGGGGAPVRAEFRPTLPELLGPRLRRLGRAGIVILILAGLVVLAGFGLLARGTGDGRRVVVVRGPVTFNLTYDPLKLERLPAPRGVSLRLQTPASDPDTERVDVRPITLPAYKGDPAGVEPVVASRLIDEMRRADPDFILRKEGRTRINRLPGYQIQFQTKVGGRTAYGRRSLLFENLPGVRSGADVTLLALRSPRIPNVDSVGSNGPTKLPYRSFRLGAERP